MSFITGDRVKETTTTAGTGTITLGGAVSQFRAFSTVASNLDTFHYAIVGQTGVEWEVGVGTWLTGGSITRVAGDVLAGSSGVGTLVSFASGTKDIFITFPADVITALSEATTTAGNRIINGGMEVDQRNAGSPVVVSSREYIVDRWAVANTTGTGTITCAQDTTLGKTSFKTTATAAVTALTSSLFVQAAQHLIEAKNVFDLNGENVVLSFIVETNWTGNLALAIRNGASNRSYVTDIAVTSGTNIVSVPFTFEATTSGNTTAVGLYLDIGTNNEGALQTATVDAWQAGVLLCSTSSTMWSTTIGNYVNVTEVQLEKGVSPTQFERKSFGETLAECQRYFTTEDVSVLTASPQTSQRLAVNMRDTPTQTVTFSTGTGAVFTVLTEDSSYYQSATHSANATASIEFDAEL